MNTLRKACCSVLGMMLLGGVAGTQVSAGSMASIDVDYHYVQGIVTSGQGRLPTTEFDLIIDSVDLGLAHYSSFGYCVEYAESVDPGVHTYELNGLSTEAYYQIAWLVETYAPGVIGLSLTSEEQAQAAALQGLIAEILGGDSFGITSNDSIGDYYQEYSLALQDALSNSNSVFTDEVKRKLDAKYMIANGSNIQDFIVKVADSCNQVPEPASVIIFGAGLLGIGSRVFKRKK